MVWEGFWLFTSDFLIAGPKMILRWIMNTPEYRLIPNNVLICPDLPMKEYVDKSEQLVEWGGTNTWTYAWQPAAKLHNATLDGDGAEDSVGLVVKPESFLEFKSQSSDSLEATIELTNNASQRKVFKVTALM